MIYKDKLQTVEKPLLLSKNWVEGRSPTLSPGMDAGRVCPNALCKDAYKWSNKVGAGRTDNKRPRLHRCKANQAYTAFHRGEVVWGFGKDAEIERPKALCKDAYKWSNKVGAGRTDNKRPRLHRCRANQAYTALRRGKGVFGKDAEIRTRRALHEAKPSECPKGDRGSELEVCFKNILFLQTEAVHQGDARLIFYFFATALLICNSLAKYSLRL